MNNIIKKFRKDELGVIATEYILLLAAVIVFVLIAIKGPFFDMIRDSLSEGQTHQVSGIGNAADASLNIDYENQFGEGEIDGEEEEEEFEFDNEDINDGEYENDEGINQGADGTIDDGNSSDDEYGGEYVAGNNIPVSSGEYLKEINVVNMDTNASAKTTVTNLAMPVWVYGSEIDLTKIGSNGEGIKFYTKDGDILDFWLERISLTNNSTTPSIIAWVKVPKENTEKIVMKYGQKSNPAIQNPKDVFVFFDDFSTNPLNSANWKKHGSATGTFSNGKITMTKGQLMLNSEIDPMKVGGTENYNMELRTSVNSPASSSTLVNQYDKFVLGGLSSQDKTCTNNSCSNSVLFISRKYTSNGAGANLDLRGATGSTASLNLSKTAVTGINVVSTTSTIILKTSKSYTDFKVERLNLFNRTLIQKSTNTIINFPKKIFLGNMVSDDTSTYGATTYDYVFLRKTQTTEVRGKVGISL